MVHSFRLMIYSLILLAFPLSAMLADIEHYNLLFLSTGTICLNATKTPDESSFYKYAQHMVYRDDSNAKSKAMHRLFRIAALRGYQESVEVLLPHVPFGICKRFNELQELLKSEQLTSQQDKAYQKISGMLLKNIILPSKQREGTLLHRLPSELIVHVLDYYGYDIRQP